MITNHMVDFFGKQFTDGCRVKMKGITSTLNCRMVNNDFYLFSTESNLKITEELVQSHELQVTESFKIKADQDLFIEINNICNGLKSLSNIIQNDTIVEPDVIKQWEKVFDLNLEDIVNWKAKMMKHFGV